MAKWFVSVAIIVATVIVGIGLWLGADIKLIVGVISLVGVICTVCVTALNNINTNKLTKELGEQTRNLTKELGEKNLKALEQRRYIDAISTERVKWINTVRDAFSSYLKHTNIQANEFHKLLESGTDVLMIDEIRERAFEITYISNRIYLLLNPVEPIFKKIIEKHEKINKVLVANDWEMFDIKRIGEWGTDLNYLYQVVLKAEWKRVKEENQLGTEITDERMNEIHISVAIKMDIQRYKQIFYGN
ncbi:MULTISPECIES: hypothetical protein [Bacillus]|uniref:hypothetical protein n=1 Tax=Bacillus TaxID=1386 RepID=UPI00209E811B|nr:hypothetical protein [Bacillus sp. 1663tsa1]MCP1180520.1 hypothetical protein [Bacillus sp. 1663tsa1]